MKHNDAQRKAVRAGRTASLVRDIVSRFLQERSDSTSLITVLYVALNASGTVATVYCSVLPEDQRDRAFAFLARKASACREYLRRTTSLRTVPTIRFVQAKGGVY